MKEKDGSFGSLSSVLHVLPSLAGVSFLDLNKDGFCHKTAKGKYMGNVVLLFSKLNVEHFLGSSINVESAQFC